MSAWCATIRDRDGGRPLTPTLTRCCVTVALSTELSDAAENRRRPAARGVVKDICLSSQPREHDAANNLNINREIWLPDVTEYLMVILAEPGYSFKEKTNVTEFTKYLMVCPAGPGYPVMDQTIEDAMTVLALPQQMFGANNIKSNVCDSPPPRSKMAVVEPVDERGWGCASEYPAS